MIVATFRELHRYGKPLLLPNAWDVGSALAFAAAGYPAIGTTSFGVAASGGRPDGAGASRAATIALAEQLCRLPVHVTLDLEDGHSDDPEEVAQLVQELADWGVAGINLEDSAHGHLVDPAILTAKILAVKRRSPGIFVNARVDNLWFGEDATVDAVLRRAHKYEEAGADGIFVPGVLDAADIRLIADGVGLPLNVLAQPAITLAQLGALGVCRVSSGSLPYRAAVDAAVASVGELRDGSLPRPATSYWEMQARLEGFR
ncbi:isocitrate lyase/phosphoenolpyruvate mutase family protein [Leucobacter sp. cx-169]|nr:isocitrate lyase/phosphoenolpyruvate mutase family protein [Leucobacter sp. cx-169]MBC9926266.1 isocitrate lyase/phosphoenolpyruvate mutase family protein [Leucobacter sp. cx-169]